MTDGWIAPRTAATGWVMQAASPESCEYCSAPATRSILHSEGMAYTPVCDKHLGKGTDAAEHCTPDGTRDPSNVVRVDKLHQGVNSRGIVAMPMDHELVNRLRFVYTPGQRGPGEVRHFGKGEPGRVQAFDDELNDDHARQFGVGTLGWNQDGKISWVQTTDDRYLRRGVATALLDYVRKNHRPDIHHSDDLSESGEPWAKSDPHYVDHPDRRTASPDHDYRRDPQSGAGNCWCGGHEGHRLHTGAVAGEIHRGLSIDLNRATTAPALRSALETYGPESPEFIAELLRNGTGTYWSRDKGFAESINPGAGLQVALTADWDGNDADHLHQHTKNLPDSWGDMSLLAPADNTVAKEFNLKPGKELPIRSIRVRTQGSPSWREVLRQPVRARTGARGTLHIAPSIDKTAMVLGMATIDQLITTVRGLTHG